jgi:hypothetical protein
MVVDFHTHIFSPEVISQRTAFMERDEWFGRLYSNPKARLASPADLLASMDRANIDRSVTCGFPWSDVGICAAENQFLIESAMESGGRLKPFATVPPAAGSAAVREAQRALDGGACGLGELNASAQSFSPADTKLLRALFDTATCRGVPVLLHTSEPIGHLYPGKGRPAMQGLCRMARAFPHTHFVLAHWGGGLPFYELIPEVQEVLANCWYDTAASAYLYRKLVFQIVATLVGAQKILFGSDFPVISQRRMLEEASAMGLGGEAQAAILGDNAARLLPI